MFTRGLRPFQPVIYLTTSMVDDLEWMGVKKNKFLLDYTTRANNKLSRLFDAKFLFLNRDNKDYLEYRKNPHAQSELFHSVGIETILNVWRNSIKDISLVNGEEDEDQGDYLQRFTDIDTLLKEMFVSVPTEGESPNLDESHADYQLYHDDKFIYVVIQASINIDSTSNLSEIVPVQELSRDIVKTYCLYHPYNEVSNSKWFKTYISNL